MVRYNPDTGEYEEVGGGDYGVYNLAPGDNQTTTPGDPGGPGPNPPSGNDPPPGTGGGGTPPPATSAAAQTIIDYYNQYLGRAPNPGDVDKWLSGAYGWGDANNLGNIAQGIRLSDEGARYTASHATPTTAAPYTNFATTGNDYSAFNTARQQDPNKSAKDAFVYFSNQAPAPPLGDKTAMQKWFQTYIAPGMNNLGHKVSSINGDSFTYSNGEGTFTVDYAQNAGGTAGANRRLQWNATPADAATAAKYPGSTTTGSGGAGGGGGADLSGYTGGSGAGAMGAYNFPMLDLPNAKDYLSADLQAPYVPGTFANDLGDYAPTPWTPPNPADVRNDPSYQFRLDESLKPMTNMRALSGLTRGGGTMKATERQAGNFASDEFGRIYDRAVNDYNTTESGRKGAYDTNLATRFNTFNTNETNRAGAYNTNRANAFGLYDRDVSAAEAEFAPRQQAAQLQFGRDWDVYKYQNDDAYRYWNSKLTAATTGSGFGTNNP